MKDFLGNLFIKNWQYKVAAFITAIAIWFYVVSEQNLGIVINAPMEFTNLPKNMRIVNRVKTSVALSLEGRREIITKIKQKGIKVQINLKEAKEGKNTYIITANRILYLPRGVSIKDISPARVEIVFEKAGRTKTTPVKEADKSEKKEPKK